MTLFLAYEVQPKLASYYRVISILARLGKNNISAIKKEFRGMKATRNSLLDSNLFAPDPISGEKAAANG